MTEQEKYFEGHRNCGIKVGDRVRVTRKAEDGENGWSNVWGSENMDDFIGRPCVVEDIGGLGGVQVRCPELNDWFVFPYFVLEKI